MVPVIDVPEWLLEDLERTPEQEKYVKELKELNEMLLVIRDKWRAEIISLEKEGL